MRTPTPLLSGSTILGFALCVSATILHVPSEYLTIQAGIDAAAEGDTVLVADGTYTGDGNRDLDFGGVNMVVMSENGPEVTIIDCEGSEENPHRGFYFYSGEDWDAVVKGFTITNGYAIGGWMDGCGGAIFCTSSSPTIEYNRVIGNQSDWNGGGIFCHTGASSNIRGNTIAENEAYYDGGGIYCIYSSPIIEGNVIVGNITTTATYSGGGIFCGYYAAPTIRGNTVTGNTAATYGGGIFCHHDASPSVVNTILWGNSAPFGSEIYIWQGASISVTYSDVAGGWPGVGNIDADPLFVTGPLGDYYLSQTAAGQPEQSPCVDAGDPDSPVPEGTTRTDEVCDAWPVDMGYHYSPCTAGPGPLLWIQVTPDTTLVARGEDLWFTVDVVNLTDSTLVFDGWVDGYLPTGNPYAGNPALGPIELTLGGSGGIYGARRHVTIPQSAPYGEPYKLCVRTGEHPDSIWAEDCFEFAIVWPPLE